MKSLVFASRNWKELVRDPLTTVFCVGFPVVLLLLMSFINSNLPKDVPMDLFEAQKLVPAMAVFGLSFLCLFSGTLLSKDRTTSFLARLFASPLRSADFLLGYILPLLPIAVFQILLCFIIGFFLGFPVGIPVLVALLMSLPTALLFISTGLLLGAALPDKAVNGLGSVLVNVAALLSGTWFDLALMGGSFETVCNLLPFSHAVDAARLAGAGEYGAALSHLPLVLGYTVAAFLAAVLLFRKKMKSGVTA